MSGASVPRVRGWVGVPVATTVTVLVLWPDLSSWFWVTAAHGVVIVAMLAGGYRLAGLPGQRSNGRILMSAGVLELIATSPWNLGPSSAVGWLVGGGVALLLLWFLLRYPYDRVDGALERRFLVIGSVVTLTVRLIETVLWDPGWKGIYGWWWPTLGHSLDAHTIAAAASYASDIVVGIVAVPLLLRHHRRLPTPARRQSRPVLAATLLGVLSVSLIQPADNIVGLPTYTKETILDTVATWSWILFLASLIAALVAQGVLARLHRGEVLATIAASGTDDDALGLQGVLRHELGDPHLRLLVREQPDQPWQDPSGSVVEPRLDGSDVLVEAANIGAVAVAGILVDRGVALNPSLLSDVAAASALALDRARLSAVAEERTRELAASRARLSRVSLEERRRLERDLHDGAQQSLLAVATRLSRAKTATHDPDVRDHLDDASQALSTALQELRDLAHGLHPAVLTQSGLGPAVEGALERLSLSAELDIAETRWPSQVESAAYFVIAEALANIVKHASATRVQVRGTDVDDGLALEIRDDGVGGVDLHHAGRGLIGMSDRVRASGGSLTIHSPVGEGTQVRVWLPCA